MELANLIVPMKHICMILNLLKLLNINCNLTASTLQTVLFFSKTKARTKKSRHRQSRSQGFSFTNVQKNTQEGVFVAVYYS